MSSFDKSPAASQDAAPTPAAVTSTTERASRKRSVQQALSLPPAAFDLRRWLCIYLPRLPLEALCRRDEVARVVFDEQQGTRRVLEANATARAAGIGVGLSVNAALSLLPELHLVARCPGRETQLLKRLALWAGQFTSFVSLESRDALLLEIAGSLRLFDGIASLRRRIARGLDEQGLSAMLAVAPTPLASIWLARSGRDACIDDPARLAGSLGPLPLDCLEWPDSVIERLHGMGVTSIADCLRLPRQGFARRFGVRFLNELDRALGRLPDPRESHRVPERFCAELELDEEQNDRELLLAVCRELLWKLERFLRTRQMQIQRVEFSFFHLRTEATHLTLGCVQAGQGIEHWFELLRIKFDRIALPAPVIAIRLRGGPSQPSSTATDSLRFNGSAKGSSKSGAASITCLVERLSARMGDAAVHGVVTVAEHRPQRAWRPAGLLDEAPRCATAAGLWNEGELPELLSEIRRTNRLLLRRPLWLLDVPEPLATEDGDRPLYRGTLTLVGGPERLESGWWDDEGIARDYFVARTGDGVQLWIYRDRRESAWYLHGLFG